jgi:hypothetical protein
MARLKPVASCMPVARTANLDLRTRLKKAPAQKET